MNASSAKPSSFLLVALAWIVVALPLGWGLYQSVMKSQPLFAGMHGPAPADTAPK